MRKMLFLRTRTADNVIVHACMLTTDVLQRRCASEAEEACIRLR
jgi:hypothetical protein